MPTHWKLDLTLIPLVGGALSLGVIRGGCAPRRSLGSLFANGWGRICCLSWGFSALMGGVWFFQNGHLWRVFADDYSQYHCLYCPSSTASHCCPVFPGDPQRSAGRSDPDSCGVSALSWDPVYMKACVRPLRVEYLFPPVLWSCCAQALLVFSVSCSRVSTCQCQMPGLGNLTWGLELWTLWVSLSSLWVAHPAGVELLISPKRPSCHLDVASFLSCGSFQSFVDGCLAVGCNFVVFMRGELQSFSCAILVLSPPEMFNLCVY